jgi:outer membrane receptor for ferrienterochelin and colicin
MKFPKFLICAVGVLALAVTALAQAPTGALTGRVDDGKEALPAVTVTITSPNLQGARTAATSVNGDYIFQFLPPGEYNVRFDLQGFQTQETTVKINAAQTQTLNATMPQVKVAEEVTVTGSYETISGASNAATTFTKQLVDELPVLRTMVGAVIASPGTSDSGPGGNITISGGQSYENLWLVNGVVVNENVRQQPLTLFIEDAVQETTTSSSGVSAEYGRFAGGVVTMLTKSGGNRFSGSLRAGFSNPDWIAQRPGEAKPTNKTSTLWEVTLGGFFWPDHIWFFVAGRDTGQAVTSRQTSLTNIPYDTVSQQKRFEGKLTLSITPEHRIVGSYNKIDQTTTGDRYTANIMDLRSLTDRKDPQDLKAANYTGVLTDNFFVEAQYSKRFYSIGIGSGSIYNDVIFGTLLLDRSRSSRRFWSPTFCAPGTPACPEKLRNNEDWLVKGSWFLSTPAVGTHDITFGYDSFQEFNLEENHQSGSDYRIYTTGAYIDRDPIVPIFSTKGRYTYFYYQPQLTPSIGSKMVTNSTYVNDKWRLSNNWSFNVGLRYDKNDGTDSGGHLVSKDSRVSPRLSATWDIKADGDLILNASLSRYVTSIIGTGNVGDAASTAGLTGVYPKYGGPEINTDPNNLVSTEEALRRFFAWLDSVGGAFQWAANPTHWYYSPDFPGLTPVLLTSLASPYTDEYTIGAIKRLGGRGMVRFDYVHRTFESFYATQTDLTTGFVTTPAGAVMDRSVVTNAPSGALNRKYDGFHFSAAYRLTDRLNLGGNYTLSYAKGNVIGETDVNGPIRVDLSYPEYWQKSWSMPTGYLLIDQRHKLRIFGTWDAIASRYHRLTIGLAQYWRTGAPYSAVGAAASAPVDVSPYVTNPGYKAPQGAYNQTYYFSRRGAYRLDDVYSTDLSITYAFVPKLLGTDIEIYVKPEVRNVFNQQAVINVNTDVDTNATDATLAKFNPFTEKPVEGVNWRKRVTSSTAFGKPSAPTDYQTARTYLIAVGIRF